MKAIIGKKLNMSQAVTTAGVRIPVTRIKAGPVVVTAVKTADTDGYQAIQIGFGEVKKMTRGLQGHLKSSKASPRLLREVRLNRAEDLEVGTVLKVADVFHKGEVVDVTATSKGKGFAGTIKRHGFHGGPKTHGQSDRHRAPGSIGSGTTPGRVLKGKKMSGRMGGDQVTTQGLEVISIESEEGILVVKGAVPGPTGGVVFITKSDKKRKIYHGPQAQALPQEEGEEPELGEEAPVEKVADVPAEG